MERASLLYQKIKRATEEIQILRGEMERMMAHLENNKTLLYAEIFQLKDNNSQYNKGMSALLQLKVDAITERQAVCQNLFITHIY